MAKYRVTFNGIDGISTTNFSRISHVANYVKARDMGEEYRRPWGLQSEFGQYYFQGFTWEDIRPAGEYLPLDSKTIKVSFKQLCIMGDKGYLQITVLGQKAGTVLFPSQYSDTYRIAWEYMIRGDHGSRYEVANSLDEIKRLARLTVKEWAAANATKTAEEASRLSFRDDS